MRPERRFGGYSLIEVMAAVAIMIVGASGLLLMQGATTRGNGKAQETTIALTVAQTWVERLRREAKDWNTAGWPANAVTTPNLVQAEDVMYAPVPTFAGSGESAWFDSFGFDTTDPMAARYFVQMINRGLHRDASGAVDAMRVDVVVFWFRSVFAARDKQIADLHPPGFDPPGVGVVASADQLASPISNEVYATVVLMVPGP